MAETVNELILGALRKLKVKEAGESLTANEAADGLVALNDLLEEWNLQPLMQPAKTQLTQVLTASDGTYTFGAGGDNSTRPVKITKAFIRDSSNNIDYPLRIIGNEEYSMITFKTTSSTYPFNLYYRAEYPLGVVELFPVPTSGFTLYLEVQATLSTYTSGTTSVDLPPGYLKAIKDNLAVQISPEYRDPSPTTVAQANNGIAWIKRMNSQDRVVMTNTARLAVGGQVDTGSLFGVQ